MTQLILIVKLEQKLLGKIKTESGVNWVVSKKGKQQRIGSLTGSPVKQERVIKKRIKKQSWNDVNKGNSSKKRDNQRIGYLEKERLRFVVGKGNNERLIKQLMSKRKWWQLVDLNESGKAFYSILF